MKKVNTNILHNSKQSYSVQYYLDNNQKTIQQKKILLKQDFFLQYQI